MLLTDRQRKKNEALASEIFGRGRKHATTNSSSRKIGSGPSLASRVGIAKVGLQGQNITNVALTAAQASQRSVSNTPRPKADIEDTWSHDLHPANKTRVPRVTRPARENPMSRLSRTDLLYDAASEPEPATRPASQPQSRGVGSEYSIRGSAGPYVVLASNFAEGTTAADIESAMMPVGGIMQSCRILTATPTVIAEMVFAEKHNADNVVSTFNNKKVCTSIHLPLAVLISAIGRWKDPLCAYETCRRTYTGNCDFPEPTNTD